MTAPATVAVRGHAQRSVPPDYFVLTGAVGVRAGSSAAAHQRLAQRFAALEQAVAALANPAFELARSSIGGWPDGGRGTTSWIAQRSLMVTSHDLGAAADLAGALGAVDDVTVEGPQWHVDEHNAAFHQLQAAAVHRARERAERYAAALGGTLGRLVELSDDGMTGGGVRSYAVATRAKGASGGGAGLESLDLTPVPVELDAAVNARWYLVLPE